ncbi:MAG: alpha/beta hydrolase [Proteobacteria bacterium]|nr:alpha/beta hydrolase [Pseudomonadota bacterium]MBU1712420.1 alpha/beta hydrolase [Pseudomonadota bacterium]
MVFDYFTSPDNVSIRYGIWDCGAKTKNGSVILLGGRKEFMEKYAETIEELKQRQFDVYSMDWRGQGLSTRLLTNRNKGHINNYGEYLEDLNYFVNKIVRPVAVSPLIIIAHSMGGHIALRFLHNFPEVVYKAVLTSPMIDIMVPPFPKWIIKLAARFASKIGCGSSYSAGSKDYSYQNIKFEGNTLTSDPVRFMDEHKNIAENPALALGGVTYGWLNAAFESIEILSGAEYAGKIKTPVLIVGAGRDRIVSETAQKAICSRMHNCHFVSISDSYHEILKESDKVRNIFWREFDGFISS